MVWLLFLCVREVRGMMQLLAAINGAVWGPLGVGLLAAAGLWMTVRTGWFQLRRLPLWLGQTLGAILRRSPDLSREDAGSISPLQSLCTALGATIGTGSIVGVGAALIGGGPGAIFWMWVMAFFGMMTAYAENLLGLRYRRFWAGAWHGGPMYYLSAGVGALPHGRRAGRALAGSFAVLCVLASFGIGNLSQVNAIAASLEGAFGLPPLLTGAGLALLTGLVLLRGMKGVASAAGRLVPFMAVFYLAGAALVILTHAAALPAALEAIFRGALGLRAAGGGIVGYGAAAAVQWGFMRGSFSSEAGLGSSAIASGPASTGEPARQGMWGIFQVFVSTFLVCTMTALAMLTAGLVDLDTGRMLSPSPAPGLAGEAFSSALGGPGARVCGGGGAAVCLVVGAGLEPVRRRMLGLPLWPGDGVGLPAGFSGPDPGRGHGGFHRRLGLVRHLQRPDDAAQPHRPVRPFGRGGGGDQAVPPAAGSKRLNTKNCSPTRLLQMREQFISFASPNGGQRKVLWFLFFRKTTYWGCLPI